MRIFRSRPLSIAVIAVTAAGLLGACGGGSSGGNASNTTVPKTSDLAKQCPLSALASAQKPVNIVYWHAMTSANEDTLKRLTAKFNASQHDVHVTLVAQGGYNDVLTKFRTVAGTSDAPDLIQMEETSLQQMIDSHSTVPAQACVDAAHADLSDILPRVRAYYTVGKVLYPVPFNVSNPVFYYNTAAFQKAGIQQAPTTFAEIITDARKLKATGLKYGFYYKRDPWVLEQFLALNGEPYVNNGNGRDKRATAVVFDTPFAHTLFHDLDTLVGQGLAGTNPASGQSEYDNVFSICNGENAMTIDTSAVLGTAYQLLGSGQCKTKVGVGVAALPARTATAACSWAAPRTTSSRARTRRRSPPRGSSRSTSRRRACRPRGPRARATSRSARLRCSRPSSRTSGRRVRATRSRTEQLATGKENVATAGPVIGDYQGVRNALQTALESFLIGSASPDAALTKAVHAADAAIQAYNACRRLSSPGLWGSELGTTPRSAAALMFASVVSIAPHSISYRPSKFEPAPGTLMSGASNDSVAVVPPPALGANS